MPALRNLDAAPVEENGETFICLSDPEGYVDGQVSLSGPAFFVAACLDGTTSMDDIRTAFAKQFGAQISEETVHKVVDFLDKSGFLQTETFFELRAEARRAFAAVDTRPAWLAGKSYPGEPGELREFLGHLLHTPHQAQGHKQSGSVRFLLAPHIDYGRGAAAYAAAYTHTAGARPRLVFVFGVAHAGAEAPFVLTRKHFATPFGTVQTEVDVVGRLAEVCPWDPFESEMAHRTEHSIEFQAVLLAHLLGNRLDEARIVPILCGPLRAETPPADPAHVAGVADFLAACREEARGGDVLVVAGADLAHVGRRFGDDLDVDEGVVRAVEARDREDLAFALKGDALGFYQSVMRDGNARKVCGVSCIYAALSTVDGTAGGGKLLHYGYAEDPVGGIVSFAGAAFPRKPGAEN
ncbi:MAG: AmmeMemoRadiSam system protein B [Candidatus Hydrogenedentes bacterium]|nr:AmmeMemoRadiSam system protein B [Candidatus Hydrogenedentota bacterium]